MKRSLSIFVAVLAAGSLGLSLTSCNPLSCGSGTVQKQQTDGTLKCVAVDSPDALTPCDVDGGSVVIVGGKCVSAVQCDPATTKEVNGVCVGSGMGVGCSTPTAGKACVTGTIHNFTDNAKNTVGPIHVALFDPQVLLAAGAPIAEADLTGEPGNYVFQNFTPPGLGLIVIVTSTAAGGPMFTTAATGNQGVGAGTYQMDAYAIKKSDSDAWGFDVATAGAQIGLFFHDPKPTSPTLLLANETMPASGVTFLQNGSSTGVQYFNDTLTAVNAAATTTGMKGGAIVAAPVSGNFPTFTGMGGGVTQWEVLPGGSAPNLVFVTRFHPNM